MTHEEVESILNYSHIGACGGLLSGLETTHNILCADYFCPTIFKDCVEAIKCCHSYLLFTNKMSSHPALFFPIITVGPFTTWGVEFMTCNLVYVGWHIHIIVFIDYFTMWLEEKPIVKEDGETTTYFVFNRIIDRSSILKYIVNYHGIHFENC